MIRLFSFVLLLAVAIAATASPGEPALTPYQRDVVAYFREIALGFEYGTASHVTRKWKVQMKIFIEGDPTSEVFQEINRVTDEVNHLATDGFSIVLVDRKEDSNFHLYFGTREAFSAIYPADAGTVKTASGIFRIFWDKSNYINRGYAFIHTGVSIREQRHAIREELTQALGLGRDSETHAESIFQSRWTLPTAFAEIDRDLIRYLYHPTMRVGLTGDEAEAIITGIMLEEMSTLAAQP